MKWSDWSETDRRRLLEHPAFADELGTDPQQVDRAFADLLEFHVHESRRRLEDALAREALDLLECVLAPAPTSPIAAEPPAAELLADRLEARLRTAPSANESPGEALRHRALQDFAIRHLGMQSTEAEVDPAALDRALAALREQRERRLQQSGVDEGRVDAAPWIGREPDRTPWTEMLWDALLAGIEVPSAPATTVCWIEPPLQCSEPHLGAQAAVSAPAVFAGIAVFLRHGVWGRERGTLHLVTARAPVAEFWRGILGRAAEGRSSFEVHPHAPVGSALIPADAGSDEYAQRAFEVFREWPGAQFGDWRVTASPRRILDGLARAQAHGRRDLGEEPSLLARIEAEAQVRFRRVVLPPELGRRFTLVEADLVADRFADDGAFELIVCVDALETLPLAARALAWLQLGRVARPGAVLLCSLQMARSLDDVVVGWRFVMRADHPGERGLCVYRYEGR